MQAPTHIGFPVGLVVVHVAMHEVLSAFSAQERVTSPQFDGPIWFCIRSALPLQL
jgi:hypothetical protein